MQITRTLILSLSLGLAAPAIALACDGDEGTKQNTKADTPPPPGAATVAFNVDGMHCGGCASRVEAAVRKLPGIYTVSVSVEKGVARVSYDQKKVKPDQIREAISKAGYKPSPVA